MIFQCAILSHRYRPLGQTEKLDLHEDAFTTDGDELYSSLLANNRGEDLVIIFGGLDCLLTVAKHCVKFSKSSRMNCG